MPDIEQVRTLRPQHLQREGIRITATALQPEEPLVWMRMNKIDLIVQAEALGPSLPTVVAMATLGFLGEAPIATPMEILTEVPIEVRRRLEAAQDLLQYPLQPPEALATPAPEALVAVATEVRVHPVLFDLLLAVAEEDHEEINSNHSFSKTKT